MRGKWVGEHSAPQKDEVGGSAETSYANGERPVCLASVSSGLGWPVLSGGVVFSKLSKLLNQEAALSGPWLRGDFGSPQARPCGAQDAAESVIRHFDCHITVCDTRVIRLASADAFPVVGGRCTGRVRRCKAKQSRRGKRAPAFGC